MKGILLAGGSGTRLYPSTATVNKHLLSIYDKPMIYYSLSTLIYAGVREILLITNPQHVPLFQDLFGDGRKWGLDIRYASQSSPRGIAEALIIAEDFLEGGSSVLSLGDNIFYGDALPKLLKSSADNNEGATIFSYHVARPEEYGVIEYASDGSRVLSIEEKPKNPRSNWVATGLYIYDAEAPRFARGLTPSARGELEITALNNAYVEAGRMRAVKLGRGVAWLDTGTPSDLGASGNWHALAECDSIA